MVDEQPQGQDRRQSVRVHRHQRAAVRLNNEEATLVKVQIMNISEGGVRFVSSVPFQPGEEILLVLNDEEHMTTILDCTDLFEGFAVRAEFQDFVNRNAANAE